MERPTCKTCPYWKGYAMKTESDQDEGLLDDLSPGDAMTGHCHLKPPYIFMQAETELEECQAVFPLTWFDAFCGEHPHFPAYIASLNPPRTVPEMEAEVAAIQDKIGTAIKESIKEFGMIAPDHASHHPVFLQEFIKRHPEIDLTT